MTVPSAAVYGLLRQPKTKPLTFCDAYRLRRREVRDIEGSLNGSETVGYGLVAIDHYRLRVLPHRNAFVVPDQSAGRIEGASAS